MSAGTALAAAGSAAIGFVATVLGFDILPGLVVGLLASAWGASVGLWGPR